MSIQKSTPVWTKWLFLIETATVVWLLLSISLITTSQGSIESLRGAVLPAACLLVFLLLSALFLRPAKRGWLQFLSIASQIVLITTASQCTSVAGFQLLFLTVLTRTGLVFSSSMFVIVSVLTLIAFLLTALINTQSESQYLFSTANAYNWDLLTMLFSRDGLAFLASMITVRLLVESVRSEQRLRQEAEALTAEIERISAEIERHRIATEINESVDYKLVDLALRVDEIKKTLPLQTEQAESSLIDAKELAASTLQEVRRALDLIRNF